MMNGVVLECSPTLLSQALAVVGAQLHGSTGNDSQTTVGQYYRVVAIILNPYMTTTQWSLYGASSAPGEAEAGIVSPLLRHSPEGQEPMDMDAYVEDTTGALTVWTDWRETIAWGPLPDGVWASPGA
jgi:hypothetical protein